MIGRTLAGILVLGMLACPGVAAADDPNDPAMRSKAARARDHEIIRQLNLRELRRVRERDARWARENAERRADHDLAMERYQHEMAAWRRAVAACRAGDHRACAR